MKNMKTNFFKYLLILAMAFTTYSCADLEVENLNEPDAATALGSTDDVVSLAGGTFRAWFMAVQDYDGPGMAMATMADQSTCSWGNAGMKDMSSEPRIGWNNNVTYGNAVITLTFWNNSYSAISAVNDVLARFYDPDDPMELDTQAETDAIKAWSLFVSGVAHGYLGLIFDKAILINWDTDVNNLEYVDYTAIQAGALAMFDEALAILDAADDFTLPDGFILGQTITRDDLKQLVHSFYARLLAYTPRNAAQNDAVDWDAVKTHATAGLNGWDLAPVMDDVSWWNLLSTYLIYGGWARIDHRIINLMDVDYPSRWPSDNNWPAGVPDEASSDDGRLASDYQFLLSNNFIPSRGYYHFSHYRLSRYDAYLSTWTEPTPIFYEWENDMLLAEAYVRTNDIPAAVAILNDANGARKVRGGLADVAPGTTEAALDLIFYERDVEFPVTQTGTSFFDMRRRDMLQSGTPLHFPIPGGELEITQYPWYTIAGAPDGINISDGSWTGKDGLVSPEN